MRFYVSRGSQDSKQRIVAEFDLNILGRIWTYLRLISHRLYWCQAALTRNKTVYVYTINNESLMIILLRL